MQIVIRWSLWGLGVWISDKLLGDVYAAGLGATPWVARVQFTCIKIEEDPETQVLGFPKEGTCPCHTADPYESNSLFHITAAQEVMRYHGLCSESDRGSVLALLFTRCKALADYLFFLYSSFLICGIQTDSAYLVEELW